MKIGVDSYSYHLSILSKRALDLNRLLIRLHNLRVQAVLIEDIFLKASDLRHTKELLERYGLEPTISCSVGYARKGSSADRAVKMTMRAIEMAEALNASLVKIVGGAIPGLPKRPQINLIVENLRKIIPYADEHDVVLAIENHGDLTSRELLEVLNSCTHERLKIAFDTANPIWLGEDPISSLNFLSDYIVLVKLRDYRIVNSKPIDVALGRGALDVPSIIKKLLGMGFKGPVFISVYLNEGDEDLVVRKSLAYLRRLLPA